MGKLIDADMPSDSLLLNDDAWWSYGAHPYALFGRCDHIACGKPAVTFMIYKPMWRDAPIVGARCPSCVEGLPANAKIISEEEARGYVALFRVHHS